MKKLSALFLLLAVLLSDAMCAVVAYNYRAMLCAIAHDGASAPASMAFLSALPFLAGIILCIALAIFFRKKSQNAPR